MPWNKHSESIQKITNRLSKQVQCKYNSENMNNHREQVTIVQTKISNRLQRLSRQQDHTHDFMADSDKNIGRQSYSQHKLQRSNRKFKKQYIWEKRFLTIISS